MRAAWSFESSVQRLLAVHLGEETRNRVGANRNTNACEQFANKSERCAFLP
jgi:hypothetical protein